MKIVFFVKNVIIYLSLIYLSIVYFVFNTTGYSFHEIDENRNNIISIFELDKYFDTSKRYRCINDDKIFYFNVYHKEKCNEIILEYFTLKDGVEFRTIKLK